MKNNILIFSLFLICITVIGQNSVTLYGTITNPKSEKILVRYFKDYLTFEQATVDSATLDKKGNFSMKFNWKKPYPASFQCGEETTDLFLTPTDNLKMTVDADKFDSTIKYTGQGAIVNNYIAQKAFRNIDAGRNKAKSTKTMDEKRYTQYLDSFYKADKDFLESYFSKTTNKTQPVTDFIKSEEEDMIYESANNKLRYPSFHKYYNKLKEEVPVSR
ncbi:MAG TPA: hypothetical protein VN026_02455 [Bacteroidia bacterium]|jgi:hypothetical protein|nr:hypothetical protein [Bacteroidia bacterium]